MIVDNINIIIILRNAESQGKNVIFTLLLNALMLLMHCWYLCRYACDCAKVSVAMHFKAKLSRKNRETCRYCKGGDEKIVNDPTNYWVRMYHILSVNIFMGRIV